MQYLRRASLLNRESHPLPLHNGLFLYSGELFVIESDWLLLYCSRSLFSSYQLLTVKELSIMLLQLLMVQTVPMMLKSVIPSPTMLST